jgi:hypothetical protein
MTAVEWLAKELLREHPTQTNHDVIKQALEMEDEFAIGFANWYFEKLTVAGASEWFKFLNKDMLNAYKKEQGL